MPERRPNVVFVLTDDQGYGDLHCTGNELMQTPNIDAFYRDAVRVTNFHVGPTCAPTRSGLMTGHYANSTGVWHTIGGRSLLRRNEWTLAAALAGAGYATGIFGKWHLGDTSPYRPHERGFQHAVVHGGGGISQTPDFWGNDYFSDTYFVNGVPQKFDGYCTDVWFRLAQQFISDHREEPFFCYLPTNAPHSPYNVPRRYADLYRGREPEERARFHGMISNIDENFGRLRSHIAALGLEENTILIFMTDNGTSGGASVGRDWRVTEGFNGGMRGIKGSPYDGGHRVPFFLRYPNGRVGGGVDVDRIAANIDFMPTILDLCGVSTDGHSFHGQSLGPLFRSASNPGAPLEADWPERVLVTDSQRLAYPVKWRQSAVMSDRWRLIDGKELYDINRDRAQERDLAGEHPDVVQQLRDEYEKWWKLVSVQFDSTIPHVIGAEGWTESVLTSHDMRNDDCNVAWSQAHIRAGHLCNGYWEMQIARAGRYSFELRRWPRENGRSIQAGIEGDDVEWNRAEIAESDWKLYSGGAALAVASARLSIAGISQQREIGTADETATFELALPEGNASLEAAFSGETGEIAAYYIYVRPA